MTCVYVEDFPSNVHVVLQTFFYISTYLCVLYCIRTYYTLPTCTVSNIFPEYFMITLNAYYVKQSPRSIHSYVLVLTPREGITVTVLYKERVVILLTVPFLGEIMYVLITHNNNIILYVLFYLYKSAYMASTKQSVISCI